MASKAIKRTLLDSSLSSSLHGGICPSCRYASLNLSKLPRRNASSRALKDRNSARSETTHLKKYLEQAPDATLKKPVVKQARKEPEGGDLLARGLPAEESIFGRDGESSLANDEAAEVKKPLHDDVDPDALMNVLDPEPGRRLAWQRKKVIQQIRKRGELTKAEIIKRSERECTVSSAMFKTSTKKLVHLAHQIAGKPIDEAILQMQLSKKRVAQDIMKHLQYAKNMAIVSRGMGLGKAEDRTGEPIEIETKDGKRKLIEDRTGIYVDQAWVNKGEESMTPDYRGRGRVFALTHRRAKITVILKEEATRIRLWQEKQEKLKNRKLWLHLPDRPVTLQRQYPLW